MRQSSLSARTSHAANSTNSQANSAAAKAQLLEKKKEFEAVWAFERASASFLERVEGLGEDFDVMADAGATHGQVLAQWPEMFKILNIFLASKDRASKFGEDDAANTEANLTSAGDGQRLVRVPIEDIQQQQEPREKS